MVSLVSEAERLVKKKLDAIQKLESKLSEKEIRVARRDHHARRRPRPCGITIHTGVGCSVGCVYCYIWDMGFPGKPELYPLSPDALAYAVAVNPWIVPERTFAAYGSVTEPFLEETRQYALELIKLIYNYLSLPSQVSTKMLLTDSLVEELKLAEPRISVLVSVTSIGDVSRRLEPRAPRAEERIRFAGLAARRGLSVALFIRPIIPGVTDVQARELLALARESGLRDVVFGSLRVTRNIISRLNSLGIRVPPEMIPRFPRGREQVPLRMGKVKRMLEKLAMNMGFRVHPSACAHNVFAHRLPCHRCRLGPCFAEPRIPDVSEIGEALVVLGYPGRPRVAVKNSIIIIYDKRRNNRIDRALFWLREISGLIVRKV